MLKDPEALENIVAASPGLDNDPVAMGMFTMFAVFSHEEKDTKISKKKKRVSSLIISSHCSYSSRCRTVGNVG